MARDPGLPRDLFQTRGHQPLPAHQDGGTWQEWGELGLHFKGTAGVEAQSPLRTKAG